MNRRDFLLAFAGTLVSQSIAAQTVRRVAWLSLDEARHSQRLLDAMRDGLRDLGYVEGRNIVLETRWAGGSIERLEKLAAEVLASKPHLIITQGGPALYPLIRAGTSIPVVFGYSGDPVEGKVVQSLERPGGNRTGFTYLSLDLVAKRIDVLKELLPDVKRIAILANPEHPGDRSELGATESAARAHGIAVEYFAVRSSAELEDVLEFIPASRSEALVVFPDATTIRYSERLAQFAGKTRIPAICGWAEFAERGNLLAYGPDLREEYRQLASYVDRILKGARAGDLPVRQPKTVELIVNRKAATTLGIDIPPSVLKRADKVIE